MLRNNAYTRSQECPNEEKRTGWHPLEWPMRHGMPLFSVMYPAGIPLFSIMYPPGIPLFSIIDFI